MSLITGMPVNFENSLSAVRFTFLIRLDGTGMVYLVVNRPYKADIVVSEAWLICLWLACPLPRGQAQYILIIHYSQCTFGVLQGVWGAVKLLLKNWEFLCG